MLRANEKGDGCHSFNEDCIGLKKKTKDGDGLTTESQCFHPRPILPT